MSIATREIPFRVDIAGVIEILGYSLYSRRDAAIRELLANAHDAILRRRAEKLDFTGEIRILQDPQKGTLSISDDGIGIDELEAETYLGTLGSGLSGILKKNDGQARGHDRTGVIGQFGVGLFSAFLLADRIIVDSRKSLDGPAVRWQAGASTSITLGPGERAELGTTVTLVLSEPHRDWSREPKLVEEAVRRYADFLPVPIYLDQSRRRLNLMTPSWFESTPDPEMVSMELEQRFDDNPLDLILVNLESPRVRGAIYVTRNRTPGFSGRPLVTATLRRMVISSRIDGLFPEWGSFYRGILEMPELQPTTSREDLIRDASFLQVQAQLSNLLLARLRELSRSDLTRLRSLYTWHRYAFTGAALDEPELRNILASSYQLQTTRGPMTFNEVLERDPTIWLNSNPRQEAWIASVFNDHPATCIQATRTFESSLITLMAADLHSERPDIDLQSAQPGNERFMSEVLGITNPADLDSDWNDYFAPFGARVQLADCLSNAPVLAFPRASAELRRDFESISSDGRIPPSFARMISKHFSAEDQDRSTLILNRRQPLVQRALAGSIHSPLASILRLLAHNALTIAGAKLNTEDHAIVSKDLDWIAETILPPKA
jgi:molecular chaperone HtpG